MEMKRLLAIVTTAALLGCSGDGGPSQPGDTGGSGTTVAVINNRFDPNTVSVGVNGTVNWVWNSDGVEHNVTFETGPNSVNLTSGSFSRTFAVAGMFTYLCTIHAAQGMTGVVNVAAGTGGGGSDGGGGGYP
jgi:plastocyanin